MRPLACWRWLAWRRCGNPLVTPNVILGAVMFALALGGLAVSVGLFYRHVVGGGIAGCGGGGACEELLASRWSQVLGVPVAGLGGLTYVVLLGSLAANLRRLLSPLLGLLVGAAAWFIFVQAVLVGRFCPWCMTLHGIGLLVTALGVWRQAGSGGTARALQGVGLSAAAAVLALGTLQIFGPRPATHRIDEAGGAVLSLPSAIHARGSGRKVGFEDGAKTYDLAALPHLGPADGRRVMVEYFDYSCEACQTMRGYLDALLAKHPADICVVVLPVPLDVSCNHALGGWDGQHPGACDLARLALAVWRRRPDGFGAFHQALLAAPGPAAARALALKLMPEAELDAALRDPWIDELIQADISDWVAFSASSKNLPKLLVSNRRILHGLPSSEADFIRVLERELGL